MQVRSFSERNNFLGQARGYYAVVANWGHKRETKGDVFGSRRVASNTFCSTSTSSNVVLIVSRSDSDYCEC